MNKERCNRHISCTMSKHGIIIGLFWRHVGDNPTEDLHNIWLDGFSQSNMQSVQEALNKFYCGGSIILLQDNDMFVVSSFLDDKKELFDMIVDSPEPCQTFLSHYVLEG